jgi:hypothetical protein
MKLLIRFLPMALLLFLTVLALSQDKEYTKRSKNEVRKGPGTFYPLLYVLPEGIQVQTLKKEDGWLNIEVIGGNQNVADEWMPKTCLTDAPKSGDKNKQFDISSPNASPSSLAAAIRGFAVRFGQTSGTAIDSLSRLDRYFFPPEEYNAFKSEDQNLRQSFDDSQPAMVQGFDQTDSSECAFGLNVASRVAATGLIRDRASNEYLNLLITYIAEAAGAYDFQFKGYIIQGPRLTAVGLPGGYIFITQPLIDSCNDEAQLAGILAHEMTHVLLKHGIEEVHKRVKQAQADEVFEDLARKTGRANDSTDARLNDIAQMGYDEAVKPRLLKYELAADQGAVEILTRIGYDPQAVAEMVLKIRNAAGEGTTVYDFNPAMKRDFQERYDALEKNLKSRQPGGERNRARFARMFGR